MWPNVGRDVAVKTVESVHQVPSADDGERCPASVPDGPRERCFLVREGVHQVGDWFWPRAQDRANLCVTGAVPGHCGQHPNSSFAGHAGGA